MLKVLDDGLEQYKIYYNYAEYVKPRPNEVKALFELLKEKNSLNDLQIALLLIMELSILLGQNKFDEAYNQIQMNHDYLKIIPNQIKTFYYMIGYFFTKMNEYDKAIDIYRKTIDLFPLNQIPYFGLKMQSLVF